MDFYGIMAGFCLIGLLGFFPSTVLSFSRLGPFSYLLLSLAIRAIYAIFLFFFSVWHGLWIFEHHSSSFIIPWSCLSYVLWLFSMCLR